MTGYQFLATRARLLFLPLFAVKAIDARIRRQHRVAFLRSPAIPHDVHDHVEIIGVAPHLHADRPVRILPQFLFRRRMIPAPALGIRRIAREILIHVGSIKWSKDGSIELGGTLPRASAQNLVFHESRLLLRADFQGRSGLAILDTGATTTDFNANFASAFADLLERSGKKGTQEISGIGGTRVFESVTLPEFTLTIGSKAVALRPATVTLQRNTLIGGNCCLANVGRDVLAQAQSVSIDFAAMSLELQEPR